MVGWPLLVAGVTGAGEGMFWWSRLEMRLFGLSPEEGARSMAAADAREAHRGTRGQEPRPETRKRSNPPRETSTGAMGRAARRPRERAAGEFGGVAAVVSRRVGGDNGGSQSWRRWWENWDRNGQQGPVQ